MIKRYLVFGYDQYYPCGGWNDLLVESDSMHFCQKFIKDNRSDFDNFQIVDTDLMEVVFEY